MQRGEPAHRAGFLVAGEDSGGPGVVSGTRRGVPWSRWTGTMQHQAEIRINQDGSRHTAAAVAPALPWPGFRAPILAGAGNTYILVRARRIVLPDPPARVGIQRDDPAARTEIVSAVADQQ